MPSRKVRRSSRTTLRDGSSIAPIMPPSRHLDRVRRGEDRAGGTEREQRDDDAAPEDEERERRDAEEHDLPPLAQRERERHRRAEDRADRGRAGAVEERARGGVRPQRAEAAVADEHERERRRE